MSPTVFAGRVAAPGTALGFAYRTDRAHREVLPRRNLGDPRTQITEAFDAVSNAMRELAESLRARGQAEQADIMETASYLADDRDLRDTAIDHARNGDPVTVAIGKAVDWHATALSLLDDPMLAERATDVRQVGKRALAFLHRDPGAEPGAGQEGPLVLLGHEIGAADLLEAHAPVVAAASVTGGPNSHAAIVARSLGIPLILGIEPAALEGPDGVEILIDGDTLTIRPEPDRRDAALEAMAAAHARRTALLAGRDLPSETTDGHPVVLRANIATPADAANALAAHADGVGLLRTELPFLDATTWPSRLQHLAVLTPILRRLEGKPVTVRTLDYADDKLPPFLAAGREGGRLGRGLPLMLAEPGAFAEQFRAILTAGAATELRIMIPMVANVEELRACRKLLDEAAVEVGVEPVPLGAMIELREAVEDIEAIAAEADFCSIGSNDLTCQLLGLDRRDPAASPAMAADPRVLQAISDVVVAAHRHRRPVSVCGDAAAHPQVVPLLIGLGVDILSVAPAALDETRAGIRGLDYLNCVELAAAAITRSGDPCQRREC
ncbi:MAG TPA: aldolase/citrate lyase family protein [Pseudonocardiaceae bacterium]|nr:aldolase/citrate lyase family protein [Pseudonocardiaceae bacterium]